MDALKKKPTSEGTFRNLDYRENVWSENEEEEEDKTRAIAREKERASKTTAEQCNTALLPPNGVATRDDDDMPSCLRSGKKSSSELCSGVRKVEV